MSAKTSGRVWDLDLPHNKRLVLLAMADHADHEGRNIYPSTDLIAWKTGYSARQVQRVIDELIKDGLLIVVKKARQQIPTTYAIDFSAGIPKAPFVRSVRPSQERHSVTPESSHIVTPEERHSVTPEQSRGDISTTPGVTFRPSRGDIAMSPEPINHREPPPPTESAAQKTSEKTSEKTNGDGGDSFTFLTDQGIGAASEFASIPYAIIRADYDARKADGQTKATIVKAWRTRPPTASTIFGQPRASPSAPLIATQPNVPDQIVSRADMARLLNERKRPDAAS